MNYLFVLLIIIFAMAFTAQLNAARQRLESLLEQVESLYVLNAQHATHHMQETRYSDVIRSVDALIRQTQAEVTRLETVVAAAQRFPPPRVVGVYFK